MVGGFPARPGAVCWELARVWTRGERLRGRRKATDRAGFAAVSPLDSVMTRQHMCRALVPRGAGAWRTAQNAVAKRPRRAPAFVGGAAGARETRWSQ